MEIKLKSEFFKRILNTEVLTEQIEEKKWLSLYGGLDVSEMTWNQERIIEDYRNILENHETFLGVSFSKMPPGLIRELLAVGVKGERLSISNVELNSSVISGLSETEAEKIHELSFIGCKSKEEEPIQVFGIEKFKNVNKVNLLNSTGLDINDFFKKFPQKENLTEILLSSPLPNPNILKDFVGIKKITIESVQSPEELKKFLEALPLENIKYVNFVNCDMDQISEELILRLEKVEQIIMTNNTNIDYNKFLETLPKKDLTHLQIRGNDDERALLDVEKLRGFTPTKLDLSNMDIDLDKLREVLMQHPKLWTLRLDNCGVKDLSFLDGVKAFDITIQEDDIDFSILSSEFISGMKRISLVKKDSHESITGSRLKLKPEDTKSYPILKLQVIDKSLPEVESLIQDMILLVDIEIRVTDSDVTPVLDFIKRNEKKIKNGFEIVIPDVSRLDKEQIEILNENNQLKGIRVLDETCDDPGVPERFTYTPEQYVQLKEIVQEITKGIDPSMPELEKFMIIYRRLGSTIKYDYGIVGQNRYSEYAKENFDNCRNMINGLMKHTCVCAGYADILYNCLRAVGLEAFKVTGISGKEYHQWNKVRIDGVLYNTDLTWDADALSTNSLANLRNCLLSDFSFGIMHKPLNGNGEKCEKSMPSKDKKEALRRALEFDGIEPLSPLRKVIKDLREVNVLDELRSEMKGLKDKLREIKKELLEEVLPEYKRFFFGKKALPPPTNEDKVENIVENEEVQSTEENEVPNNTDASNNPWRVDADIINQVNIVSRTETALRENNTINIEDRGIDDE